MARSCGPDTSPLARLEEDAFYATFYCASVTRCYPGRAPSGGGDRTPTAREQELCSFWREWELGLLRPRLIVVVGGLAARRLLGLKSLDGDRAAFESETGGRAAATSVGREPLAERPRQPRAPKAVDLVHAELAKLPASP